MESGTDCAEALRFSVRSVLCAAFLSPAERLIPAESLFPAERETDAAVLRDYDRNIRPQAVPAVLQKAETAEAMQYVKRGK